MSIRTRSIEITHVEIRSPQAAANVHAQILQTLPKLDPALAKALRSGDADEVARLRRDGPPLWLFGVRDMGSLIAAEGRSEQIYQYEIGNPLTAESMARYQSCTALYAPLRVVLYGEGTGCVFAYDRPSDLFGQFEDDRVTAVGRDLDRELETAISRALEIGGAGPL